MVLVEAAQDLAEANQQAFTESSIRMTKRGRERMRKVANGLVLEPVILARSREILAMKSDGDFMTNFCSGYFLECFCIK